MTGQDADKGQAQPMDGTVPGPDVMLRLWASWMDQMSAPAHALADPGTAWWQMTTNNPASSLIDGGVNQLQRSLSQDPTLRSIDQMWNANPLREVVPVDWAEIARALRIVWLRSLRKPSTALAVVDLNQDLWRSALEVWQEAGQRWLGIADSSPPKGRLPPQQTSGSPPPSGTRTPSIAPFSRSTFSRRTGSCSRAMRTTMDEAERQRINFHLRQFVDAMSPTLMLMSNPAALRKAIETGGASVAAGAANLIADLNAGRLSMVDARGLCPRPKPCAHARKGGPPQSPDRADPVHADHREGSQDAAADPAALDQQVLHPRHAAEEQPGALPG